MSQLKARAALWLDGFARDVRYAFRTLSRTPAFTAAAVLTLGLGIGANTAIFSLIETAMLRGLPIAEPERLVFLFHGTGNQRNPAANYPFFERVSALTEVFDGVTTYTQSTLRVELAGSVEPTSGQFVPGNYHGVLGVPMALGRALTPDDDRAAAESFAAVISHTYWQQKFGGTPDVLGKTLLVQGQPVSIVGVTAPGFNGLQAGTRADVSVPYSVQLQNEPDFLPTHDSVSTDFPIVARLKHGVTQTQALAALEATVQQYLQEPEATMWRYLWQQPRPLELVPAVQGDNLLRNRFASPLMVLMAVVGIVLAIGCANVAALVLARASARMKEVAVRLSVGAHRRRIVRELFTESLLLAGSGGVLGLVIAIGGAQLIAASFSGGEYPLVIDARPNATVLLFTSTVSVLAVMAFGLYPAYSATRVDVAQALKEGGSSGEVGRSWWGRKTLVVAQISLSLVLVVGAGLLVRSFFNLAAVNVGFDRSNVLLFSLDFDGTDVRTESLPALCESLLERLRARPGAAAVSCSTSVPVRGSGSTRRLTIPSLPPAENRGAFVNSVTAGYFDTFGIALLRGRAFADSDTATSPGVAIINEQLAREEFGDTDPLGQTLRFGSTEPRDLMTIVGIVSNALQGNTLRDPPRRTVYTPLSQEYDVPQQIAVAVRSTEPLASLTSAARTETRAVSADAVVTYVRTMEQQIGRTMVRERVLATLSSWFGALALALACVGLYGIVAHDVARRRRDIGIRLALGARPTTVARDALRRAGALVAAGLVVGLAGAFAATRFLGTFLYDLGPADPLVLGAGVAMLALTALAASYVPARRAARISPAEVLRAE
jgi:putative ABC transport system permease protein